MHLMNGYTTARVKNSEGCTVLDCGCAHTTVQYVQMCDPHFREWHAKHERAKLDHPVSP